MPGIVDPVFAADEVVDDERTIGPRQHVVVQAVHLAERRAHLADFRQEPARQRRERQESFLDADAFLAERDEEVGARIRIDDRLERRFRFVHLERRIGWTGFLPAAPRKSPMTAMSGLNTLAPLTAAPVVP